MKMKIGFFLILLFTLFLPSLTFAHPGNTDSSGCHTCHTNCISWGLSYGEYHCHTPKYIIPTIAPLCPLYSYRDSLSGTCTCMSGYFASGNSCISYDQSCKDQIGYNSTYNLLTSQCECLVGNIIDPNTNKCTSAITYCSLNHGFGSKWNYVDKKCECTVGYVWNENGKCITKDESCHDQIGIMSKYNFLQNACECWSGYSIQNGTCLPVIKKQIQYKDIPVTRNTNILKKNPTNVIIPLTIIPTTYEVSGHEKPYIINSLLELESENTDVEILQTALSSDPDLYPEGKISGYYGDLTRKAVEKFQSKYGLDITGKIDPLTLVKFNEIYGGIKTAKSSKYQSVFEKISGFFKSIFTGF